MAVNLSARNLVDRELPDQLAAMLDRLAVAPSRLELEITESMVAADPERALAILMTLRRLGVRFALDDFGTGYSSLGNLRDLPIDRLKIDRSFVTGMTHGRANEVIVDSTIGLAHQLGLEVVAEGIETAEHHARLVALGCDTGQGYWLGRPMDADRCSEWLQRRRASATGAAEPTRLVVLEGRAC
jgi:EAL domain-containing protein (putative c-di-GMP-specific phosphodiesterase class I)